MATRMTTREKAEFAIVTTVVTLSMGALGWWLAGEWGWAVLPLSFILSVGVGAMTGNLLVIRWVQRRNIDKR